MTPIQKIAFNYTDCGVPFLVNAGQASFMAAHIESRQTYMTDFYELYFFAEDTGFIHVNGERIALQNGMALFLSPAHKRQWEVEHTRFRFLIFVEDFLANFMSDPFFVERLQYCGQFHTPLTLQLSPEEFQHVTHLHEELKEELQHINRDTEPLLSAMLSYLLLHLNRLYSRAYHLPYTRANGTLPFEFKRLLEERVRTHQRVEDYTSSLSTTRAMLDNALKGQFGMSTSEMIKRRLLIEIKNELLYSNHSPKEIAFNLGFSEPHHMLRFFKTMTGETIGE